jgi:hypothetical protein
MHKCPHCNTNAVDSLAVRWSGRLSPATCGHCGKHSHVLTNTSSGIFAVGFLLLCLTLTAALTMASYAVAVLGLCAVVAHNLWAWRRVELFPIDPESVKREQQVHWLLWALAVLARLLH